MTGRKSKVIYKIQPLSRKPIPNDIFGMLPAEFAKILGINNHALTTAGCYLFGLQPAMIGPALYRLWADVKCHSQRVLGKAVFTHLCISAEAIKHMPD